MAPASEAIIGLCRRHGLLAIYVFGSRADDGLRRLAGRTVQGRGSDLDVGVVFQDHFPQAPRLGALQADLEDVFAPLRVDLVPLQRVDPLFQYAAVSAHRVATTDEHRADLFELLVLRRAAEALPLERERERLFFGATNR
jgi:predicted nucleotidyltransferase